MVAATAATESMQLYFDTLQQQTREAYALAQQARERGFDPETKVDIPLAANMAERVAGLISLVAPQLSQSLLTARIKELEMIYQLLDWRVGLKIAEEVTQGKFCPFATRESAMDIAIRVGFAYLTLGIVAAPLEGFIGLKIKKRRDGKEYLAIYYAGPVRGAGGTAAAVSVILSDYVRIVMGLERYDPTEDEVNRFVTEVEDYHERVTNLQYRPSNEEIRFLVQHIPVEINGDPTEEIEVSNHKDLPRVETNRIRGGICLVLAEGLAQKSPKIWKRLSEWGKDFNLDWSFLQQFLDIQKKVKAQAQVKSDASVLITPNFTYISDLVAGRPVLGHPLRHGGFRLRYGRTPASGFSAAGVHPLTLAVLHNYIATGTQLKLERPGKAASVTPCDAIEGPTLKLTNGSVVIATSVKQFKDIISDIQEIIYLGDLLVSYGDFSENGHKLVPAGYCEEWWVQEVEKATVDLFGALDHEKLSDHIGMDNGVLHAILTLPLYEKPSFHLADTMARRLRIPLHPSYTYFWSALNAQDFIALIDWFTLVRIDRDESSATKIVLPLIKEHLGAKRSLEILGVPHEVINNEFVIITGDHAACVTVCAGLADLARTRQVVSQAVAETSSLNGLQLVALLAPFLLRDKAGTFIGARMGRPEKAKMRKMAGSPHILFPVGKEGDRSRSFQSALRVGKVSGDFPLFVCSKCGKETIYPFCNVCNVRASHVFYCRTCGVSAAETCSHGKKTPYKYQELDIQSYFKAALDQMQLSAYPDTIKGVRGTLNKGHTVENIAKGIIRAKHNIYVNKDGTTRYDMTELPLTHFKPRDVGTSVEKLRELGYTADVFGNDLANDEQILELKVQDIVLPLNERSLDESSRKVLYRVCQFIDELLVRFYGLDAFYNLQREEDLVGHLVIGLAPHISAGLIGRIVGFSETQGCFAHPLWHAGLRRDCDGDECCVMMLMDALLNFSRQYLPDQRGAKTMDSPLVLTSQLIPSEVDDQSHGLDVQWRYPLQLYEAALNYKDSKEVKIDQIKHRLGTPLQYEKFGFTHPLSNLNMGIKCSAYKTIPTMEEKVNGQLAIAIKLRAVDAADVARLIIEKHFIKDIKGNLRRFSMQQFRCVGCGESFRRPPLIGKCNLCSGKLIFTVTEGSITKYLPLSLKLTQQFQLPPYLVQTLEIVQRRIDGVFGRAKEKQSGLKAWAQ
jgi:DNA polymerase II large subunit